MIIRELFIKLGIVADDKALDTVNNKLESFKKTASAAGAAGANALKRSQFVEPLNLITDSARSARNSFLYLAGAISANSLALGGFFKVIGNFEQTEIAFETLIGDADKAKKTLTDLQQFARATPFNFAQVADLSKRLLAFSFEAEQLIPTMDVLGNIAAGVGTDKLPYLVLALGQVKTAGRLTGAELRQFTENGVPLIAELSKTLGVTKEQVRGLIESGKVSFDDVYKSLQRVTGEGGRFNNLMGKQSKSLLGIFSNIIDTVQQLAVALGKRGPLQNAKNFLSGILTTLETNREQILGGMQHAIEVLVDALEKMIKVVKGAWRVFQGWAQLVGGTRKAIDLLIKSMFILTGARMIWLLGSMVRGFVMLGNAGLAANAKILLIPLAIGAAVAAIALLIEDIVAYFQGRKSITGLIMGNLDGLGAKFEKLLEPLFEKAKEFAKSLGKSIVDGISAMSNADWEKFGQGMLTVLELMLRVSTVPLRLGIAIANGLIQGLEEGLRGRFPKFAEFFGFNTPNATLPEPGSTQQFASAVSAPQGIAEIVKMISALAGFSGLPKPHSTAPTLKKMPAPPSISISAPVTVTVPAGTPPESVGPSVTKGVKDGIQGLMRETSRATAPAVSY